MHSKTFQISFKILQKSSWIPPKPSQNPPKIEPEPSPNPPLEGSWAGVAKCLRNSLLLVSIWAPLGLHFGSIFNEKSFQKSIIFFDTISHWFWHRFWSYNASQNLPKTAKNHLKIHLKKSSLFLSIWAWISQGFLLQFCLLFERLYNRF